MTKTEANENTGWKSKQTLIANRDIQRTMLMDNQTQCLMTKTEANGNISDFDFRGQQYIKYLGEVYVVFFSECGADWYRSGIITKNNLIWDQRLKG